jgi:hypothetical protein
LQHNIVKQLEELLDVVGGSLRREDSRSTSYHSRTVVLRGSDLEDVPGREREVDQRPNRENPLQIGISGEE